MLTEIAIAALAAAKATEAPDKALYFRGTQHPEIKGHYGTLSFATSLPVALIWSARPPDVWARRSHAEFLPTSTTFAVHLAAKNPLTIEENYTALGTVLRALKFGKDGGITEEEALRIYNYLHNRLTGKARGGEFLYELLDEDDKPRDEDEIPFSLVNPQTLISLARDELDYGPLLEQADRLFADTFIFFDAPIVKKVAARLGYDAFIYADVFAGGEEASKDLFGCPVGALKGITFEYDLRREKVPVHQTVRPLSGDVQIAWQQPSVDLVKRIVP